METPKHRKIDPRSEQPARNRNPDALTWDSPPFFLDDHFPHNYWAFTQGEANSEKSETSFWSHADVHYTLLNLFG